MPNQVVRYPASLPGPTNAPIQSTDRRALSPRPWEARETSRERLATEDIRFVYSSEQMATFRSWWRDELVYGGGWWVATWPVPQGLVERQRQFVGPYKRTYLGNGFWEVTGTVQLRGSSELPTGSTMYLRIPFDDDYQDKSPNKWTMVKNRTIPTVQEELFYLDDTVVMAGSGARRHSLFIDYNSPWIETVEVPPAVTGDFELMLWVKFPTYFTSPMTLLISEDYRGEFVYGLSNIGSWQFFIQSNGNTSGLRFIDPSNNVVFVHFGASLTQVTPHHLAVKRKDGLLKAFVDGVGTHSTVSTAPFGGTYPISVGSSRRVSWVGHDHMEGWMDDIYFRLGCESLADFSPPTYVLPLR